MPMCHGHGKTWELTDLGHTVGHTPMCQPMCHTWPVDMPVCLGHVKTLGYTDLNRKSFRVVHLDHGNGIFEMDLEDALLGIDKMPSTLTDEEKKRKDQKALTKLHLHFSNEILQGVMNEKIAAALWKRLEQICMSKTLTSKLHMKQHLYAHRLEEGVSVHKHLIVFKEILSNSEAMEGESLIAYGRQDWNADNVRGKTQERNPRGKSNGRSKSSNRENLEDYSDGELLVAFVNDSKVSEEWTLDLGYTFDMSPNWDWFTTYETVSEGIVLMGNNASCKTAGVGTIKVKIFDGVVRILSDMRHVPKLKRNLISLSTLDSKGYRYTAESGVLKISKGSLVVMKGQRKTAKLYVLQGSTVTGDAAVASSSLSDDDITKLWHMRLGHMSEHGMVELAKEDFLMGKELQNKFLVPSRGGANYMLTFIDDFSRKVWAFFLKQKSDILKVRRDCETLDNSSYSIAKWSYRMNEQNDHGEGLMYVVKYQLTEIFGCPAYAHVDNGKLEPRFIKCVFLGYKVGVKGYKLWCPENRKVLISRDVVFDETAMLPNLSLKGSSNKENQKQSILGVDFTDVFSPVVKHSLIRALLGIVAMHDLELEQLDVKIVFLHGELEEDIYMQQPESPRQWYKRFDSFMTSHDSKRSSFDSCVYFKKNSVGPAKKILGMDILKDRKTCKLYLSQKGYIEKVLCRFNMQSAKPISTPLAAHFRLSSALTPQSDDEIEYMSHVPYSSAVGSLIYAMVCSHLDLSYAVSAVSRYMANLGKEHWKAVQWILRYLRGTTDVYLQFGKTEDGVIGYVDANFAGDLDKRRSLTGYVFTIGGCAISWKATLQTTVALSTAKAEYMEIMRLVKKLFG
ncbi:hypothetical protein CXB51_034177 [Gossypium anomalum]|uniref:Retrovirus-related Pol polyprotein from transposon TNT 1-94 n=1 Tax=Gossypium anomalum TaxID=47600 RepID=A0A8J5Y5Y8_9ROSI|nr:hypothetical protein CXB51_034177 [Gossypium anomalum]